MTFQDNANETSFKELHEGTGGNGNTIYIVATVRKTDGEWIWQERFNSKAEAMNWIQYC